MKKMILTAVSAFALLSFGTTALACDCDKNKTKADKVDQNSADKSPALQKEGTVKANQKS